MSFVIFALKCAIAMCLGVFVVLFALGMMHQHLKSKGEAFGDGISNKDLNDFEMRQAAEERLRAANKLN